MKTALFIVVFGITFPGLAREARIACAVPAKPPVTLLSAPARPTPTRMEAVDIKVRSRHRLMEVQVVLASQADRDTQYEYSTCWFDADGVVIPSFVGSWFVGDLPGLSSALIHEMAPSPDAVSCTIECREVFHGRSGRSHSQPLSLCINSDSHSH